jgi:hypothetical protein
MRVMSILYRKIGEESKKTAFPDRGKVAILMSGAALPRYIIRRMNKVLKEKP